MTPTSLDAFLLGLVQGLTEFLPVSSSGHLALTSHFLGLGERAASFLAVWVHGATLLAVALVYRADLAFYLRALLPERAGHLALSALPRAKAWHEIAMLAIATLPAVVVGLALKDAFEEAFASARLVAGMLVVTGLVVGLSWWWRGGVRAMTWQRALLIGLAQAAAITPGISRSGMTIVAALMLRMRPAEAVRFSFLMSIPAIAGGLVLALKDGVPPGVAAGPMKIAAVAAFVSALGAIWAVRRLVDSGRLWAFAPYCALAGVTLLVVL